MMGITRHLQANGITSPLEQIEGDDGLFALTVSGDVALSLWHKLRSLVDITDHWPVILGDRHEALRYLADACELDSSPIRETLDFAKTIEVAEWIRQTRNMDPEIYESFDEGPWTPEAVERTATFALPLECGSKRPRSAVLVALVPTRISAEVPAFLRFGGWNACPEAGIHVAFAQHWHQRYGAEIICAGHDILEMTVARPPATREEALILAREQYMYCGDIVDQGVGTVSNLAAALLNGRIWYFWWD